MIYTARIFDRCVLLPLLCVFSLGAAAFLIRGHWWFLAATILGGLYTTVVRVRLNPRQTLSGLSGEESASAETVMLEAGLKMLEQRILVSQACTRVGVIIGISSGVILHSAFGWQWYSSAILGLLSLIFSTAFLKLLFRAI